MMAEYVLSPDSSPDGSLSAAIVEAVADREDCNPTEIEPLYDAINPDALNALFFDSAQSSSRINGEISFEYCGYLINVTSDGRITIDETTN